MKTKLRILIALKRILSALLLFAFLIAVYAVSVNSYIKYKGFQNIISVEDASAMNVDCILVLGAGVWENKRPSHMLEDRLLVGIELYETGASERLLMSGDNGQIYYDEVNVMKNYAIEKGVPSGHIFMDHAGFSTYESMYRAKYIFGVETVIIVTQGYHLLRAVYIAEQMGMEAYAVASDLREYSGQKNRDIREFLARNKDFLQCIYKPEPTFLGDAIPIQGDGDVTND